MIVKILKKHHCANALSKFWHPPRAMNALGTMSILTLYHHRGYFGVGWKWFLDCKKTSTTLLNALLEIGPFEKNMTNFENLKQTKLFF